jgi:hypothetical protein
MVDSWWSPDSGFVGIFIICGVISGLIVLDCDTQGAEDFWRGLIGAQMDATVCVKTHKGHHYYFALPPGLIVKSERYHVGEVGFDIQAEGHGVMAPPSLHPDGGYYEWVRDPDEHPILNAPSVLLNGLVGMPGVPGVSSGESGHLGASGASFLVDLLMGPPVGENSGRNNWLAAICGHYAKLIPYEDAYRAMANQANALLEIPLDQVEVNKVAGYRWKKEQETKRSAGKPEYQLEIDDANENNGWLLGGGGMIWCPAKFGWGKTAEIKLAMWADFDVRVLGKVRRGESVDYLVELTTLHSTTVCELPGKTLGRKADLDVWLAERQAVIIKPSTDLHKGASTQGRLLRYVKSQDATEMTTIDYQGWHHASASFLTFDGVIRAEATSFEDFDRVRPSFALARANTSPYRFGFEGGTRYDFQDALREMMTHQERLTCAVTGSFFAASLLQAQIHPAYASLFPFLALQAPSESGKTNGFFSEMSRLFGNVGGHGEFTAAAFRDRLSATNAGVVVVDDMSDLPRVLDLIRQNAGGGHRTKKGEDHFSNVVVPLRAAVLLAGEHLPGIDGEKALMDRAIRLEVTSPIHRMSQYPGCEHVSQWEDVLGLAARYIGPNGPGDFSQLAGHGVAMAMECVDGEDSLLSHFNEFRPLGVRGRAFENLTILRFGSRVLCHMMGVDVDDDEWGWVVAEVDRCVNHTVAEYDPDANMLVTKIIPYILRQGLYIPTNAGHTIAVYVSGDSGRLNVNPERVSDVWLKQNSLTQRERDLGDISSIMADLKRILGPNARSSPRHIGGRNGHQVRYFTLDAKTTEEILYRAGEEGDEV